MRLVLAVCLLIPAQGWALEICDDLWFTRNLTYDRAGQCFGSSLGKAVFDNEGCTEGGVSLDAKSAKLVMRVRETEAELACDVDTSQDFLAVPVIEQRKTLVDLPLATEFESACIGWKGDRVPLHTARNGESDLTGAVRMGDTLLFQYEDVDGWTFVELQQNGIPAGLGWAQVEIGEDSCEMMAG